MRRIVTILIFFAICATPIWAGDPVPFSARAGLDVASDAALSWAPDAELVYLENDEMVRPDGTGLHKVTGAPGVQAQAPDWS